MPPATTTLRLPLATGGWLIAIGALVMIGWHAQSVELVQLRPNWAPMKFNTALCFLVAGIGLIALTRQRARVAQGCGGCVVVIAALTGFEYVAGADLDIDELVVDAFTVTRSSHPGRMAFPTVMSFAAGGTAIVLAAASGRAGLLPWVVFLGAIPIAMGFASLLGYALGVGEIHGWSALQRMAIHTAVSLVVFGVGVISATVAPGRSASLWRSRAMPFAAATAIVAPVLLLATELRASDRARFDALLREEQRVVATHLQLELERRVTSPQNAASRWEIHRGIGQPEWLAESQQSLQMRPGNRARAFIDPSLRVQWLATADGAASADDLLEFDLGSRPRWRAALEAAARSRTPEVAIETATGGAVNLMVGAVIAAPDGAVAGFIADFARTEELIATILPAAELDEVFVSVRDGSVELAGALADAGPQAAWSEASPIEAAPLHWTLRVAPTSAMLAGATSGLPAAALATGLLMALLLGVAARLGQSAALRAEALADARDHLEVRVASRTEQLRQSNAALARESEERRLALESLQRSELRFRGLVADAPIPMMVHAEDGEVVLINRAWTDATGYHPEELRSIDAWTELAYGSEAPVVRDQIRRSFGFTGSVVGGEYPTRTRSGDTRIWEMSATPAGVLADGRRLVMAMGFDLTERKRADELERSNAELEQFAHIASHDLQEPLRMVASFTQLLASRYEGKLDADAQEFIRFAAEGAERMRQLIRGLLEYSRASSQAPMPRQIDSEEALAQALANLMVAIEESGAVVTHDPLPWLRADQPQLIRVFQNLVGNAIKFRSLETPRIHVSASRGATAWTISVRDNCVGFEPMHRERIFRIFQRLHTEKDYPGSGVGLAICKRVVERHGGRIWVESVPGVGSTFSFTIPVGPSESDVPRDEHA